MNQEKIQIPNQENMEQDPLPNAEISRIDIERQQKESSHDYLVRAAESITAVLKKGKGVLFDSARVKESDLSKEIITQIETVMLHASEKKEEWYDSAKNKQTLIEIENAISFHGKTSLESSEDFDKTQRSRGFFEQKPGTGAASRETYWNTLFFPYNTESTREFAKQDLDEKTIVLLGGGRSELKQELSKYDIHPKEIINVDPFVEDVKEGADYVVHMSASDHGLVEKLKENGIENVDEVWAEYSVPAYLENPAEISQLLENIDTILAPGGSVRIWPLQVGGGGSDEEMSVRKEVFMESLRKLDEKKYNIVTYKSVGREGIILKKYNKTKAELHQEIKKNRIDEVRSSLGI